MPARSFNPAIAALREQIAVDGSGANRIVGNRLAVDVHVLTIDSGAATNLFHCIRRCDLELA